MHAVESNQYDIAMWLMDSIGLDCHEPHKVYYYDGPQILSIICDLRLIQSEWDYNFKYGCNSWKR